MIDDEGMITEGTASNAWIVTTDGELVTRATDHSILSGITRGAVLRLAREHGLRAGRASVQPGGGEGGDRGVPHQHHLLGQAGGANRRPRRSATGAIGPLTSRLLALYVARVEHADGAGAEP